MDPTRPLIVQSDLSILVETNHPEFEAVKGDHIPFRGSDQKPGASPYVSDYAIIAMECSAAGMPIEEMSACLQRYAKFGVPPAVLSSIRKYVKRYGILRMENVGNELYLS